MFSTILIRLSSDVVFPLVTLDGRQDLEHLEAVEESLPLEGLELPVVSPDLFGEVI